MQSNQGYAPAPGQGVAPGQGQQVVVVQQSGKPVKYCGPLSCIICVLTGCCCIYFCPCDTKYE